MADDKIAALCYFTRLFSTGIDAAEHFDTESAALKYGKACVKRSSNPKAYATVANKIITQSKGRLKVKVLKR